MKILLPRKQKKNFSNIRTQKKNSIPMRKGEKLNKQDEIVLHTVTIYLSRSQVTIEFFRRELGIDFGIVITLENRK